MNSRNLPNLLAGLPVPEYRFFESIGSTNEEALRWAMSGAPDGSLVVADAQTEGRGRMGRRWITIPGAALAFSLILHPTQHEMANFTLFSPLGAVAICEALETLAGLEPQIKWPNDVLIHGRKAAGILVEAAWLGDQLKGIIIGIGLNVRPEAVPPAESLLFPATSVAGEGFPNADRDTLLRAILEGIFAWRTRLGAGEFWTAWEKRLAFRGAWVRIDGTGREPVSGQIVGLDAGGGLLLRDANGVQTTVAVGDVHLRPA